MSPVTQSKSTMQQQEVCTVSSILLLLTLIGNNMEFISFTISLGIHYTNTFHYINYKTITIITHGNRNINNQKIGYYFTCIHLNAFFFALYFTFNVTHIAHLKSVYTYKFSMNTYIHSNLGIQIFKFKFKFKI